LRSGKLREETRARRASPTFSLGVSTHRLCILNQSAEKREEIHNEILNKDTGIGEAFIFRSTPGDNGRELKRGSRVIVLRADKIHEGRR
jgi:hypothetical protein